MVLRGTEPQDNLVRNFFGNKNFYFFFLFSRVYSADEALRMKLGFWNVRRKKAAGKNLLYTNLALLSKNRL